MTILFCGDTHGEFAHVVSTVKALRPEAIVFLGDLEPRRPLDVELEDILGLTGVWFIYGNHDTDADEYVDNLWGSALADRNLDGRVIDIAGVRIGGLGGVFRERIWRPPAEPRYASAGEFLQRSRDESRWRGGLPRRHWSSVFPETYQTLANQRADILVTHEAPSAHPHGFDAIDLLAAAMGVRQVYHGHHHDSLDYGRVEAMSGFRVTGVGLCGITDDRDVKVVPGRRDAARLGRKEWS